MEDSLQHKKALYLTYYPIKGLTTDSIKLAAGTWYTTWINDVRTYQKVIVETSSYKIAASPGQKLVFHLTISNPYPHPVSFSNKNCSHQVVMEVCLFKGDALINTQNAPDNFNDISLQPGGSTHYTFTLQSPVQKGKYDLVFSLRTDPFPGSKNSRIVKLTIN